MSEQISEAFAKICELATALGIEAIHKLDGCWEHQVDEKWWIAVNGHREKTACSRGARLEFGEAYIEFNGWPSGVLSPVGGTLVAHPNANEDLFIRALDKAIERAA